MLTNLSNRNFYRWPNSWVDTWESKSLSQQFALMSSVVLLGGMIAIGAWVSEKIETSVTYNTAVNTAFYIDSFVGPHAQELATQDRLSQDRQVLLNELLNNTTIGSRIASFKIWKPGGLIAYSSRKENIGKVFPETENLKNAWAGSVSAEFDTLEDEEDAGEHADGVPYLEMYSPIREKFTGRVIAVAEFYEEANLFQDVLFRAKLESWLLVTLVTMVMLSLLFVIVRRGSRTIENQELVLKKRILELSDLRNRLKNASKRSTELNERFLRRVGSDLHDGPAQLLGLAMLRLDTIRQLIMAVPQIPKAEYEDLDIIQNALTDALAEIRDISAGLVLPELDGMNLSEILTKAVSTHENRTHTSASLDLGTLPACIGKSIQICLYRLVQEGLNNAVRHAPGAACSVSARSSDSTLEVEISDTGSGFDHKTIATSSSGLGLPGLRERIESVGGQFEIRSNEGQGTQLVARFSIADLEETVSAVPDGY
jgi:signal transduction histidine kinase